MAKELDFDAIKAAAESHRADMSRFLRAMISHPSESCEEGEVVACIKAEMESLGYDEVKVDGLGNVMGFMGEGDKISLMPLLAKRLGLDPTVMASPLISTILDAVSLILFFNIAVAVLNM